MSDVLSQLRTEELRHELLKAAISWALADRRANLRADEYNVFERELERHPQASHIVERLGQAKLQIADACDRESKADAELKRIAKLLLDELEK